MKKIIYILLLLLSLSATYSQMDRFWPWDLSNEPWFAWTLYVNYWYWWDVSDFDISSVFTFETKKWKYIIDDQNIFFNWKFFHKTNGYKNKLFYTWRYIWISNNVYYLDAGRWSSTNDWWIPKFQAMKLSVDAESFKVWWNGVASDKNHVFIGSSISEQYDATTFRYEWAYYIDKDWIDFRGSKI